MAHVARSIEVDEPVDAIYEQWTVFEGLPRCAVIEAEAGVHWRAEVLTFEPKGSRTRITLRINYDPTRRDDGLSHRVEAALESFKSFLEERADPRTRAARR